MLRAAHLRLGHAAFDHTAKVFGSDIDAHMQVLHLLDIQGQGPEPNADASAASRPRR